MANDEGRFYRITYHEGKRPELLINQKSGEVGAYDVADISEKGIGLVGEDMSAFQPELKVKGQITFSDGETIKVEGEVSRVNSYHAVIYLTKGIPASRIKKEWELLRD